MPIIEIFSNKQFTEDSLTKIKKELAQTVLIPEESLWILCRPSETWQLLSNNHPVVFINYREVHALEKMKQLVIPLQNFLAVQNGITPESIYVALRPLPDDHVVSPVKSFPSIQLKPIGTVYNDRKTPLDDDWNSVESKIILNPSILSKDCTHGLREFSHIEVVFFMNQVQPSKINSSKRHPRGNTSWPEVGILSQRGKDRPNQVGVTACKLIHVDEFEITVQGLDAIDLTPVLDIKPVMSGFIPKNITEPAWSLEIMNNYF